MQVNQIPSLGKDNSLTHCCPKFDPEPWDDQTIELKDKPFVRMQTRSFLYMPLNIGKMLTKTWQQITDAKADDKDHFVMLSQDKSAWKGQHYLWVAKPVPGADNVTLTGVYRTKVFEGPYRNIRLWYGQLTQLAKDEGYTVKGIYFYYAYCPKCSKKYGKNYVIGFVQVT